MKARIFIYLSLLLAFSVVIASEVLAQCPEGKNPVQITTPSGNTKTLCIPDAAVQGIENAAEHSGGTIVASNCPCYSLDDVLAMDAIDTGLTCTGQTQIDINHNVVYSNTYCSGKGGAVSATYDYDSDNFCYRYDPGDKLNGILPVKISEVISDSEYDVCLSNLDPVFGSTK